MFKTLAKKSTSVFLILNFIFTSCSNNSGGGSGTGNVSEPQAYFDNPVSNSGAYIQKIPIIVPPAIKEVTPNLNLVYSSQRSLGVGGVGWDIPIDQISLSLKEGYRPASLDADLSEVDPGHPIERYQASNGTITVTSEMNGKTFLFNPNNDNQVLPAKDSSGRTWINGEVASWRVKKKNGTIYRYGYKRNSSLYKNYSSSSSKRKVVWFLDQVKDIHGNKMEYFYEEYPGSINYRQPILRAIKYGFAGPGHEAKGSYVIYFSYKESPFKRSMRSLGTKTDYAYVLDKVCTYPMATLVESSSIDGSKKFSISGTEGRVAKSIACTELKYDFEGNTSKKSFTGRPLLNSVTQVGNRGGKLPSWKFEYTNEGEEWHEVHKQAISNPVSGVNYWEHEMPDSNSFLNMSTRGLTQTLTDIDGDGILDVLHGSPDGEHKVQLGRGKDSQGVVKTYNESTWNNPLKDLNPLSLNATKIKTPESAGSACWNEFEFDLNWSGSANGMGYAKALTSSPEDFYDLYDESGANDEYESAFKDLGAFQFLTNSFFGGYPRGYDEAILNAAETFDELEEYGSYKDSKPKEASFDWRASDCQDKGDKFEVDYCWNVGEGRRGILGSDLACFDAPGGRWFTYDSSYRGYSSRMWELRDINGDGYKDWVLAANIIQRDKDGSHINHYAGGNDWYVGFGNGSGWDIPIPWTVPARSQSVNGVSYVHGSEFLGTSTSFSSVSTQSRPIGLSFCLSPNGFMVAPVVGSMPTPSFSASSTLSAGKVEFDIANQAASLGISHVMGSALGSDTAGNLNMLINAFQTAGGQPFCMSITTNGISLPIIGDPFYMFLGDVEDGASWIHQDMIDIDGDGRPDYLSSDFENNSERKDDENWIVMKNTGDGFLNPRVMSFPEVPEHPIGWPSQDLQTQSGDHFSKVRWFTSGVFYDTAKYGKTGMRAGLVDMNGDGLLDYVTTIWVAHSQAAVPSNNTLHWKVYYNQGDGFTAGEDWAFEGGWNTPGCDYIHHKPAISSRVYYEDPTAVTERAGYDRQVMGMFDFNRDGLLDFWHLKPYDGEAGSGSDGRCGYVPEFKVTNNSRDQWKSYTNPLDLNTPIMVRLNSGSSFKPPVQWVGSSGFAPSGSRYKVWEKFGQTKVDQNLGFGVTGMADINADGIPELSVSDGGHQTYRSSSLKPPFKMYKVTEGHPDRLSKVTTPYGGTKKIAYRYHTEPGGDMPFGVWVVDNIEERDHEYVDTDLGNGLLAIKDYEYRRGVFDRVNRKFLGFERVYQTIRGAGGYTVSRYVVENGFDGLLFCRETRKLGPTPEVVIGEISQKDKEYKTVVGGEFEKFRGVRKKKVIGRDNKNIIRQSLNKNEKYKIERKTGKRERMDFGKKVAKFSNKKAPTDTIFRIPKTEKPNTSKNSSNRGVETVANSLYGSCQNQFNLEGRGNKGKKVNIECPTNNTLDEAICALPFDPGQPVKQEFYLWEDKSQRESIVNPKLVEKREYFFGSSTSNVLQTKINYEYDIRGNIKKEINHGDVTNSTDDAVVYRTYNSPNLNKFITGSICEVKRVDSNGSLLDERFYGIDGGNPGECQIPNKGMTTIEVATAEPTRHYVTKTKYSASGLVSEIDKNNNKTKKLYHSKFPFLEIGEEKVVSVYKTASPTGESKKTITLKNRRELEGIDNSNILNFAALKKEVASDGSTKMYEYDQFGREAKVILDGDSSVQPTTEQHYFDFAFPPYTQSKIKLGAGIYKTVTSQQDGFGRDHVVKTMAAPNSNSQTEVIQSKKKYDSSGRIREEWFPYYTGMQSIRFKKTHVYDLLGRKLKTTYPDGSIDSWEYSENEKIFYDALGNKTVEKIDGHGRTVEVSEYEGSSSLYRKTTKVLRADGIVNQITDQNGNVWKYDADLLGNYIYEKDPNSGEKYIIRDSSGNPKITYDGRYTTSSASGKSAVEWEHDQLDRPTKMTEFLEANIVNNTITGNPRFQTFWFYDLDSEKLVDASISCPGKNYSKNKLSRVDKYAFESGNHYLVSRQEYCYDSRGRVSKSQQTVGSDARDYEYDYNGEDSITELRIGNGKKLNNYYSASGHLVRTTVGTETLVSDMKYNAFGFPTKKTFGNGQVSHFCYQKSRQRGLVTSRRVLSDLSVQVECDANFISASNDSISIPSGSSVFNNTWFEFDSIGRISKKVTEKKNLTSGLAENNIETYDYDDMSRLKSRTKNGNTTSYEYDELDNLIKKDGVDFTYGDSSRSTNMAGPHAVYSSSSGISLEYDEVGSVKKITKNSEFIEMKRDLSNRVLELNKNGNALNKYEYDNKSVRVSKTVGDEKTIYTGIQVVKPDSIITKYVNNILGIEENNSEKFYYQFMPGSESIAEVFDKNRNYIQSVEFSPFGKTEENLLSGNYSAEEFQFSSKEFEEIFSDGTGIYDFGARFYMPDIGRWLSLDENEKDGSNRYAFVKNDPVNNYDPDGRPTLAVFEGTDAHEAISYEYQWRFPSVQIDIRLDKIADDYYFMPMPIQLLKNLRRRPDLYDPNTGFVYEIKPFRLRSLLRGKVQVEAYVATLNAMGSHAVKGPMFSPNSHTMGITRGFVGVPVRFWTNQYTGYYAYFPVADGLIAYHKIPKSEYKALLDLAMTNASLSDYVHWMAVNADSELTQLVMAGLVGAGVTVAAGGITAVAACVFADGGTPACEAVVTAALYGLFRGFLPRAAPRLVPVLIP